MAYRKVYLTIYGVFSVRQKETTDPAEIFANRGLGEFADEVEFGLTLPFSVGTLEDSGSNLTFGISNGKQIKFSAEIIVAIDEGASADEMFRRLRVRMKSNLKGVKVENPKLTAWRVVDSK